MCVSTFTNPTALAVRIQRAGFGMCRAGFASCTPFGFKAVGAKTVRGSIPAFRGRWNCPPSVRSELTIVNFVSANSGTSVPVKLNRFSTLGCFPVWKYKVLCRTRVIGQDLRRNRGPARGEHDGVEETPSQKPSVGAARVNAIGNSVSGWVALTERAITERQLNKVNSELIWGGE